jgi:hypothetical protein
MTTQEKDKEPALGLSFQINLDQHGHRQIVFQTHVGASVSDGELNETLDKIARAAMRQKFWTELEELEQNLVDAERALINAKGRYEDAINVARAAHEESGRRGAFDINTAPAQQKQHALSIRGEVNNSIEYIQNGRQRKTLLKRKLLSAVHLRSDSYLSDADREGSGVHEPGGAVPQ